MFLVAAVAVTRQAKTSRSLSGLDWTVFHTRVQLGGASAVQGRANECWCIKQRQLLKKKKEVPEYLQIKKFSLFSFFFNKKKKENEEKEDENGQLETV